MQSNILAICDDESEYADFLVKQLLRMREEEFQVCKFSSDQQLLEFSSENKIACLVVSELYESIMEKVEAKGYLCLTTERRKVNRKTEEQEKRNIQYVYRYQSIEKLYQKIQENQRNSMENASEYQEVEEGEAKFIGLYNPVHRNGQTLFAKALAREYGRLGKRVLYLNMEEYAGVAGEKDRQKGDLGEVLFYLKQDIKSINFRLAAFTKSAEGYEYVEPMAMSQELRGIESEEWMAFLGEIKERSGYDVIILDLDSCIQGLFDILLMCQNVYVPIRREVGGEEKRLQFEENLKRLQMQNLRNKLEYQYLPSVLFDTEDEVIEELRSYVKDMEGM